MGGRGAMMHPAGIRVYEFEAVRYVEGIKILEPKKKGQLENASNV